jgi:hypothetical protein
MYHGTKVCRAKESCWCHLGPWSCDLQTPYLSKMNEDFWLIFCKMMSPAQISCLNFTLTLVLASYSNYVGQRGCFLAFVLERVTSSLYSFICIVITFWLLFIFRIYLTNTWRKRRENLWTVTKLLTVTVSSGRRSNTHSLQKYTSVRQQFRK